ncbi:alkaline phosphatase family protein, partial [Variovorax sp. 2RAF20]
ATRSIRDVEHVVILMQENRSFDNYFGTLKGVRGFGDRFPIPLAMTLGHGEFGPLNVALLLAAVFGVGLFIFVEATVASPLITLA